MWFRGVGLVMMLILSLLTTLRATDAQPSTPVHRIGLLRGGSPPPRLLEAFRQGLRDLGYVEGQNLAIESRAGEPAQLPGLAAELVRLNVDVMVTGTTPAALAAKGVTTTLPIVMAGVAHPETYGLIASLARPGGNVTGLTHVPAPEFFGKGLELLKEAVPALSRVAVFFDTSGGLQAGLRLDLEAQQTAARALDVTLVLLDVHTPEDLTGAFATILRERVDGLFVFPITPFPEYERRIIAFATTHRLPTMFQRRENVQAGGLMSY
jgi:putative ABC transport system substrate-binding protein